MPGRPTALQGLVNGSLTGKRPQTVFTPRRVLDRVDALWGLIYLDNCWHPDALTNPLHGDWIVLGQNGLRYEELPPRTFTNPPFGRKSKTKLPLGGYEEFLALFSRSPEAILLGPTRTNRRWYRAAMLASDAVCLMDPIRFEGYEDDSPMATSLHYRGPDVAGFVRHTDHEAAKAEDNPWSCGLGDTVVVRRAA